MAELDVSAFIDALDELESEGKLDDLVALFDPNAELSNPNISLHEGPGSVRRFWTSYRQAFDTIHSEFRNVIVNGNVAVLEWTSNAQDPDGDDIRYSGVTVLEFEDGKIVRFRAYFDPLNLGEQLEHHLVHHGSELGASAP